MSTLTLQGAITALITPFKDGQIDEVALRQLVDRQIAGGIHGLVPCGTTGEASTMSEAERLRVIEIVVEQAQGRVPIIAGTGSNDTHKTLQFTQKAAKIQGVDAALVVVPYYNKPNQPMMLRHFSQVAEEGGLPVVVYNVPGRTVVSLHESTIAALAQHPNIIGIKEATGDINFDTRMIEALGEHAQGFALLSGDDFTTMPFIAIGGHGCISVVSNLDPATMSALCTSALAGDLATARQLHLKIQPLARALFAWPNPVPTKHIAAMLGWCSAEVRAPLYEADADFVDSLKALAQAYGLQA